MSKIVLNDVFSQWLNDKGIIKTLTDNYDVPWKNIVDGSILDLEYHGNRSGGKIIAPLVEKLITKDGISDENTNKLCGLIYSRNNTNWQKLWDTLSFEYNPLENYNMQETEGTDTTNTGTIKNIGTSETNNTGTIGNVGNASTTNTGTVSVDNDISGQNNLYGFNSTNPVGDSTNNGTSNTTTNNDLTENVNTNNTQTNNTKEKTDSDYTQTNNLNVNEDRTLTRKGNIGVTTSQQMITQERILWDWKFFDRVFSDIDMIVVTQVYGDYHDSLDGLVINNNNNYILPIATDTILGGIKVGDNLTIDNDGKLSVNAIESNYPVTSVNGQTGDVIIDIPELPVNVLIVPISEIIVGSISSSSSINIPECSTWTENITQGVQSIINAYNSNKTSDKKTVVYILDVGDLIEPNYQLNNDNFGILTFERVGSWGTTPTSQIRPNNYRYVVAVNGTLGKMYSKYYAYSI